MQRMAGRHYRMVWTQRTGPATPSTRPTDMEETNPNSGWPLRAISLWDMMMMMKRYSHEIYTTCT
jgi:hypothetical protein